MFYKKIFTVCLLLFTTIAWAKEPSTQLIVVSNQDINSPIATLQRYERNTEKDAWHAVGAPIPVTIGKNGMAWDANQKQPAVNIPIKKEGDNRTPIGLYSFGFTFGFAKGLEEFNIKYPYLPITKDMVCVDDVKSPHYNQIANMALQKKTWNSGEQMRQVPGYKWGVIIEYNYPELKRGAGSCIFMHIWKHPGASTAGCIAMSEENMKTILKWLDAMKNPMIRISTKNTPRCAR